MESAESSGLSMLSNTSHTVQMLMVIGQRFISTTAPLYRVKRQTRKYRPLVPQFYSYGATHRLMRGLDVTGERYGPLFNKPDFTYLDGRPTPLTHEQTQEQMDRKEMAAIVMTYLENIDDTKEYAKIKEQCALEEQKLNVGKKLQLKS